MKSTDYDIKPQQGRNFFSPMFVKKANLHYINEEFEECIEVCRTGLLIYPDYLTAKLILLKAFLKCEYLNEAENLYKEIRTRIHSPGLMKKLRANIDALSSVSNQEKIYFPTGHLPKANFSEFERSIDIQEKLFPVYDLKMFLEGEHENDPDTIDPDYEEFLSSFNEFHFDTPASDSRKAMRPESPSYKKQQNEPDALLGKVKIITETLADLYADQGNLREAFEAYNFLLRAGSPNFKRIEEKLIELERKIIQNDKI